MPSPLDDDPLAGAGVIEDLAEALPDVDRRDCSHITIIAL